MKRSDFVWTLMCVLLATPAVGWADATNAPPVAPPVPATLKQQLSTWTLPEVAFRDAEVATVIEYLKTESKKLTPDQAPINIVWLVPPDAKLPRVTMQLRNISFEDVLRYVTQLVRLRYRIEEHAVVIKPRETPPPPPAPKPDAKPQ